MICRHPPPHNGGKITVLPKSAAKVETVAKLAFWHVECLLDAVEVIEKPPMFDRDFFGLQVEPEV